ncbi:hypothetical protein [Myxococcus fulvus]|uniref:hypothetical protein n=1 Tax=Myxococcus fulvus TaxID=33 RepID=UPI0020C0F47A|nr:hypothetical protein [Myxococcus fulvus]MCK8498874.1 hypothetical protein [Myxococcus fulvus]
MLRRNINANVCLNGGLLLTFILACAPARRYFSSSELATLDNRDILRVAPGPWEHDAVPTVYSNATDVPDDLIIPALATLMTLPGATDACDPSTGRPRADAAEYCLAVYRTPEDWRVSWPIRNLTGERSACTPPFGGVEDKDFGRQLPVFGFAHNHPCGTNMSSSDLRVSPAMKSPEGQWTMVEYAVAPDGSPARDARGQLVPVWAWLATGSSARPRIYKWNPLGEVFRWNAAAKRWYFQATCEPQRPGNLSTTLPPPRCVPELDTMSEARPE